MYEQCALYVFPSIHEGFGLPLLEAMACGAPAIGSNVTSIPEVIGYEKALFDPYNPEDIANKIKEVLTDPNVRADLKKHALTHSENFKWEKSAKLAVDSFETLVKNT
jgi:glycosyltransferase involved in cell wall biosynthesis